MAPHADSAGRVGGHVKLRKMVQLAGVALQHAGRGDSTDIAKSDLAALERDLSPSFAAMALTPGTAEETAWMTTQSSRSLLVMYSLALRRSSPFASAGEDSTEVICARLREKFCNLLGVFTNNIHTDSTRDFCSKVLLPALLRTDTFSCYSRLLAQAAEQLQPAAVEMLHAPPPSMASPTCSPTNGEQASVTGEGEDEPARQQQRQQQRGNTGLHAGQQGPRTPLPELSNLLCEVADMMLGVGLGAQHDYTPLWQADNSPRQGLRAEVEASHLLEHWARLLLLGTAPALAARGERRQQSKAQELQASLYGVLCSVLKHLRLDWASFLRRPWGCTLAAIQMVGLCSLLNGGPLYGLLELRGSALPLCRAVEQDYLLQVDQGAVAADTLVRQAVSLMPAVHTLRAWTLLLAETMQDTPGQAAGGTGAGAGPQGAPMEDTQLGVDAPAQGGGVGSEDGGQLGGAGLQGAAGAGQQGPGGTVPDGVDPATSGLAAGSPSSLPPLNRPATIALCLRLAKGVLACWEGGASWAGVAGHAASPGESESVPLLPKLGGYAALYHALACARLALLPAVWGRERVPRRTRAQLRAWWETYVAAAQHPEALMVAVPMSMKYPGWVDDAHGVPTRPSADAAAAIEAGLLPCMACRITCMGAAGCCGHRADGGAILMPPKDFPGFERCWPEVLVFGPLGQVAELVSAAERRLLLAAEELRRVAAGGDRRAGSRGGRSVGFLASVACEALNFTRGRLLEALWHGLSHVQSGEHSGVGGEAQAAAALRVSYATCELLPFLSRSVQVFTELGLRKDQGTGSDAASVALPADVSVGCTAVACDYASLLLARYSCEAAEAAAAAAQGGLPDGDEHGSGAAEGGRVGGAGGAGAAWRQLLLHDVRLMELLGVGVEMLSSGAGQDWGVARDGRLEPARDVLRDSLACTLDLAAVAFPAEFRAAAGGAAAVAALEAAGRSGGAGSSSAPRCAPPCISFEGVYRELGMGEDYTTVGRVLRGWDPTPGEAWVRARDQWGWRGVPPGALEARLRLLVPPAEARAAVAAAAAAIPASG